jgi:hypothetical protein
MAVKHAEKNQGKKPLEQPPQPPALMPVDAARKNAAQITPQVALASLLVSWLCLRDFALWAFVQGVDSETPLSEVDLSQIEASVAQMNAMRGAVMHFAQQIAGKNDPVAVLNEAIAKVRRDNEPLFSLSVQNIPSAF